MIITAIGQDSHAFASPSSGKALKLGGVEIPGCIGLKGNSDADVILHALTNAVSGISGVNILGEISDNLCHQLGIKNSQVYLEKALETLGQYKLIHVSISVECKRPHLAAHIPAIKMSIANMLSLESKAIGLTATSGEGLTAFGQGLGIQVFVIVTARKF